MNIAFRNISRYLFDTTTACGVVLAAVLMIGDAGCMSSDDKQQADVPAQAASVPRDGVDVSLEKPLTNEDPNVRIREERMEDGNAAMPSVELSRKDDDLNAQRRRAAAQPNDVAAPEGVEAAADEKAMELLTQGRYLQAIEAFKEVVDPQKRELDRIDRVNRDRDNDVDVSRQILLIRSSVIGQMTVHEELGDLKSAENSCLELLELMESTLGPRHPLSLDALLKYAHVRELQGGVTDSHLAYQWCVELSRQYGEDSKPIFVDSAMRLGELYAKAGQEEKALALLQSAADAAKTIGGSQWVAAEGALARHAVVMDKFKLPEVTARLNTVAERLGGIEDARSHRLQLGLEIAQTCYLTEAYLEAELRAKEAIKKYGDTINLGDCVTHGRLMLLSANALLQQNDLVNATERYERANEILAAFVSPAHPLRAEMHSTLAKIYLERSKQDKVNADWLLQAADQLCQWTAQRFDDRPDTVLPPWFETYLKTHQEIATARNDAPAIFKIAGQLDSQQKARDTLAKTINVDQRRYRYANIENVKQKAKSEAAIEDEANRRLAGRGGNPFRVSFSAPTFEMQTHRTRQAMAEMHMRNAKYFNPHTMGQQGHYQYQQSLGF